MDKPAVWLNERSKQFEDANIREQLSDIEDSYRKRHWHQLTVALQILLENAEVKKGTFLIDLYNNFISDFQGKINQLTLAQICITISNQFQDPLEIIEFLDKVTEIASKNEQAKVLLRCTVGNQYLKLKDFDKVKQILDEAKQQLDSITGVDASVYISFYHLSAAYHESEENAAEYYKDMLLYLAYVPPNYLPVEQQVELAFKLCVAALTGENVFHFSELLSHSVFESLEQTNHAWLGQVVRAFNVGNINGYKSLIAEHKDKFEALPTFVKNQQLLTEKIRIFALMENVFTMASDQRVLSFAQVSAIGQLPENEVELLLMKALSLGLIKGTIDEVESQVNIRWVQPRLLELSQLATMTDKLATWQEKVASMHSFISEESPELLSG